MTITTVLDEDQHAAVHAGVGPLLIVAGAGAGKTRVLVQRAAHLIRNGISNFQSILTAPQKTAPRKITQN